MTIQDSGNSSDVGNYDSFRIAQSLNADVMLLWCSEMARRLVQKFVALAFHCTKVLFRSIIADLFEYRTKKLIIGSCSVASCAILLSVAVSTWRTDARRFMSGRGYRELARRVFCWVRADALCGGVGIVPFRKRWRIEEAFLLGLSGRRLASSFIFREFIECWDDMSLDAGRTDR